MRLAECRAHIFWNIGISATAIKSLVTAGYTTFEDLAKADNSELLKIRGLGRVGINKIREFTNSKGTHERVRINALEKKKKELLLQLKNIDNELEDLYKTLQEG